MAVAPATAGRADALADGTSEARVEADVLSLLSRMTLAEKIGQLNLVSHGDPPEGQIEMVREGRIGAMLNVVDPALLARYRAAGRESRLGIPVLLGLDAVDAFRIAFPPPIAWAATWRPDLAEAAARAVGREAAAAGINWTFAPMVDVSRDPRWGRVVEGAGEDPHLASVFAAARTRGYRAGGVMPTAKHYVGYGAVEAGRDYNTALIPLSELYDRHLPPFRASIEAGAETVMTSLNAVNGVPATINTILLDRILKGSLGFQGFVTSDYNAIGELLSHGVAGDLKEAVRKSILAGIDLDMEGDAYNRHLEAEVTAGRVPMAAIDAAVRRVLRIKFLMGLFDNRPVPAWPSEAETRTV
ncbi:MAG: glycosyl hydrolase, partial [Hyphomicrobiaceae bacterium]|nr:glycosyl hydrolase [Hyphomicrobiaceae bacterium]